jgi:hypothetical protein
MGIFDPSFPEIREINAERREAITEQASHQVSAGPTPNVTVDGGDLLVGFDTDTGYPIFTSIDSVSAGGSTGTFASLRIGSPASPAYPIEVYGEDLGTNQDRTIMRIRGVASSDPSRTTEFWGQSGLRVDMAHAAGVVNGSTDSYLVGVRVRMAPRAAATLTAVDDVVGLMVTNKSYDDYGTTYSGTEALYIGKSADPAASQEWNSAIGIDTVADKAISIDRGPYNYGLLINAPINPGGYAIRIPNDTMIGGRNAANNGTLDMMKVDASNNLRLGSGTVRVVVGAPASAAIAAYPFEIHTAGTADGAALNSHMRVVDTSAAAANEGGVIGLAGYQDGTPTVRTFGAIKGGKENGTSGNSAGYLGLWSRDPSTGLAERLRITSTGVIQVPANGIVGGFFEMNELTGDPAAGASNTARLFVKDNGAGKTQLVVRFATGAVQVIATEP